MTGVRTERPVLSVVIPTKDRRETLAVTLEALERQEGLAGPFEVIVVDDGSSDDTSRWLGDQEFSSFFLHVLRIQPSGPAAARNRGVGLASAERVLLLGDDTMPVAGALAAHLEAAGGREVGVQGFIEWDPSREITPVMRFLAPEGPQFWFKGLSDGDEMSFYRVYGSNLSAPTAWFVDEPFDERFKAACFEDTELAWRWNRRGRKVYFGQKALCHHRHHYDIIGPVLDRQRAAGAESRRVAPRSFALMWLLWVRPFLKTGFLLATVVLKARSASAGTDNEWNLRCRIAFFRGVVAGMPRSVRKSRTSGTDAGRR